MFVCNSIKSCVKVLLHIIEYNYKASDLNDASMLVKSDETSPRRVGAGYESCFSQNLSRILIGRGMIVMAIPIAIGAMWQIKSIINT